jgi:hypothetical protein
MRGNGLSAICQMMSCLRAGCRYCDTEKLSNLAWSLFGGIQPGWRAHAISDYPTKRDKKDEFIAVKEPAKKKKAAKKFKGVRREK